MADENIEQLFVSYDTEQDRLLLRVITSRTELRAWLTRRVVRALWPALASSLAGAAGMPAGLADEAREALAAFEHEQAVARSTFIKGYRPSDAPPAFGGQPLLVTAADAEACETAEGRRIALRMRAAGDREVTIRLGPDLSHSLCKLIADSASQARWDLDLGIGREAAPPAGSGRTVN